MKVPVTPLAFVVLALCGRGHAGPCIPKSQSASTTTLSVITDVTSSTELPTTSTEITSTATETVSSAEFLTSTELSTTSTVEATFSTETTTSVAPTTTTSEESLPTQILINTSFDEPNENGEFDGSPWALVDAFQSPAVSINTNPALAHTGSYSAYWTITTIGSRSRIGQTVSLEEGENYVLSYWWLIDEDQQPTNAQGCYIAVIQTNAGSSQYPEFFQLVTPLPLKTWTKRDIVFTAEGSNPTMSLMTFCNAQAGMKVAIDDVTLFKQA